MKFKQRNKQNQQIERITPKHVVIGVDIAKEIHVARAVNYRGIEIGKPLKFADSKEGFIRFQQWLEHLQSAHRLNNVLVGMEPTGHYWFHLADWLLAESIDVVLVNPATTKRNKENRDNSPSKSDMKDALVIADVVSRGYYTDLPRTPEVFQRLRVSMNYREICMKDLVIIKNRITRWLDVSFPEYTTVFKDWTVPRSLATLQAFPLPRDIKNLDSEKMIAGWKPFMKRVGGSRALQKAAELLAAARRSVGRTTCQEEERRQLANLVADYLRLEQRIEEMQKELIKLLEEIPELTQRLRSIQGLGTICIAALLAGTGNLETYTHGNQILSQAGLNLAEKSSGKYQGQVKITGRGRPQLRKHLYLGVISLVSQNPAFRAWHEHNVKQKKMKPMASIFKLIGKLCRIIVGLVRQERSFDPKAANPAPLAA
ncbi:IS110 family transposase [Paenibacillus wynnii]|uniref:IS110 family transposase n=1 Tax=Paenibacillus wynnii TaxID=268407 RepID=UPI00279321A4|nr:IS110 family transposase [Paenibacillus wynnii]MDQ0196895.1 transposase [Paenibacillus wynnii]